MKTIKTIDESKLAKAIVNQILPANPDGFSIHQTSLRKVKSNHNSYFVSFFGHELKVPLKGDYERVYKWLRQSNALLQDKKYFVVGWYDTDTDEFILDISSIVNGYGKAISYARMQRQKCIYHPHSGKTSNVEAKEQAA